MESSGEVKAFDRDQIVVIDLVALGFLRFDIKNYLILIIWSFEIHKKFRVYI